MFTLNFHKILNYFSVWIFSQNCIVKIECKFIYCKYNESLNIFL